MSIFRPKIEVTAEMLSMRLSDMLLRLLQTVENSLENLDRAGVGEMAYQAMKYKTDSLVAFAVQWAIKTSLETKESGKILDNFLVPVPKEEIKYYWERFGGIPGDIGVWKRSNAEYIMAGLAFQETCGTTGNREVDNLIRQFGANIFGNVFKLARQEISSVSLREPFLKPPQR